MADKIIMRIILVGHLEDWSAISCTVLRTPLGPHQAACPVLGGVLIFRRTEMYTCQHEESNRIEQGRWLHFAGVL